MTPVDPQELYRVLVDVLKVKRTPVAITYCRDAAPAGYEPASMSMRSIMIAMSACGIWGCCPKRHPSSPKVNI
jgi:hypothetical protein